MSYSRNDSDFVLSLTHKLRASGARVWLDQLDIQPGMAWDETIAEALQDSDALLLVLSKASVDSKNVNDEYSYALDEGKTVVPVLLEECEIPFRLRRLQYVDFTRDSTAGMNALLQTLGISGSDSGFKVKRSPKRRTENRKALFYLLGGVAGLALLYWVIASVLPTDEAHQITVLVHEENSKDKLVLPGRGQVTLIYGDANVVETINAKGEATFKQIPAAFFETDASVEILFSDPQGEPYRVMNPDSLYNLEKGTYIALPVKLFGLDQIQGIARDFETGDPLEGVRVSISGAEAFTNEYGEYTLSIPTDKQQKFQTVRAFKTGYELFELSDVPIQTDGEIPISLKPKIK